MLLVPNTIALVRGVEPVGMAVATLGAVLSLVLVGASLLLYRSEISTLHVMRVAGWNLLGLVVLGGVLLAARSVVTATVPTYLVTDVLAVSAFAHLVIGVNDVRRIRARELAREQEKLAVVNRLLRHNLRHEAQILLGYGESIEDEVVRERVTAVGERLAEMNDRAGQLQGMLEDATEAGETVELSSVVADATERLQQDHPNAAFDVSIPDELSVRGDERLERVVYELVENALVHAGGETVTITANTTPKRVELVISDEGPGLPEMERAVLNRDTPITQVSHSKGFGLWVSKWLTETVGGDLGFGDGDESAVVVRLDRASA